MPGPLVVPVQGDETVPRDVDVVVIGGGIIGVSTALELADDGLRVALCEKGGIGHEQSSRNWGWVRITRRDPREVALMSQAMRLWAGMGARTGRDTGYVRSGIMFTCPTDRSYAEHEAWIDNVRGLGLGTRMVPGAAVGGIDGVKGALFTPEDGRAEPQKTAPAIAEAARDRGAHILTGCAVRGVETSAGAVSGVVTERGRIGCRAVVLAGGAWSNLFAGNAGVDLPQLRVLNSVLRTEPLAGPEHTVWAMGFAFRKRQDGGYTIASGHENVVNIVPKTFRYARAFLPALRHEWRSLKLRIGADFIAEARVPKRWSLDAPTPFEAVRVLDPAPDRAILDRVMRNLARDFPVFAQARVAQRWAGYIDATPDAVPVISPVDHVPGFFIATGFSGHGFGIGPAAGRLMADLVTGCTPLVDPADFRLSRFTDGSKIKVVTGF